MRVFNDTRFRIAAIFALYTLGALIAYRNILNTFFLSDDFGIVEGVKLLGPFGVWTDSSSELFRPLISVSAYLDFQLWGLNAAGFHLTNVFLHAVNAFLIFLVAKELIVLLEFTSLENKGVAVLAGAIFIVLPVHVESVTWIAGRTDVIATVFALLSFYFYLLFARANRPLFFGLSLVAFIAALLSKEATVTFPLVLVCLEAARSLLLDHKTVFKQLLRIFIGYGACLGLYVLLRLLIIGRLVGGYSYILKPFELDLAAGQLANALARTILPVHPSLIAWYSHFSDSVITAIAALSVVILLALVTLLAGREMRHAADQRPLALPIFLILGFVTVLIPVFTITRVPSIQFLSQDGRLLYLPSVFSALLLAFALGNLYRVKWLFGAIASIIVIGFALSLDSVNETWVAASHITQGIVTTLSQDPPQHSYVIMNLPDNLQGAYIFREGFSSAARLFVSPTTPLDSVITSFDLPKANTAFTVTHVPSDGSYRLQADDWTVVLGSARFTFVQGKIIDTAKYSLFSYGGNALSYIFRGDTIPFYYSQAQLHRIDVQQ